jgi:hypothetical protein
VCSPTGCWSARLAGLKAISNLEHSFVFWYRLLVTFLNAQRLAFREMRNRVAGFCSHGLHRQFFGAFGTYT